MELGISLYKYWRYWLAFERKHDITRSVLGAVLVEIRTLYVIIEMKDNARYIKKLYFYGGSYMNIAVH